MAPDRVRPSKPSTPPNQVHRAGRGLALNGPADMAMPADRLAAFIQGQLHTQAVQNFKLSSKAPNQAIATGTATLGGKAEVALDGAAVAKLVPKLPDGVAFNGRMLTVKPETIDKNVHAAITGVSVENGQMRLRVGDGAPSGSGNQLSATSHGKLTVGGITIEDADVSLVDKTPGTASRSPARSKWPAVAPTAWACRSPA